MSDARERRRALQDAVETVYDAHNRLDARVAELYPELCRVCYRHGEALRVVVVLDHLPGTRLRVLNEVTGRVYIIDARRIVGGDDE